MVTGTSLHGQAPVGANLVSVTSADIAATGAQSMGDILATVPSLSGMGSSGQGQSASYYQPNIHELGGSGSSSTLVLIDGHRIAPGGTNHTNTDPGIIPTNMIEQVDVLAEGASSTYGSDAVAGVVNFITRSHFDGVQLAGQTSFENGATSYTGSVLAGRDFDGGSLIFAYSYMNQGALAYGSRAYTNPDHTAQGGTNFNTFNCSPATLQPGGAGPIFTSPTSGISLANNAANSPCNAWANADILPQEVRNNVMIKGKLDLSSDLTVTGEMVYGTLQDTAAISRGTVTATAYGAGPQANPFYVSPAGYTGTATNETVRWDADSLFGPGAESEFGSNSYYADTTFQYKFGNGFHANLLVLDGHSDSYTQTTGVINQSVANLYLNGTTNSNGSLTAASVPGTNGIITNLPLTAADALDVWNTGAANRTSQSTLNAMLDDDNLTRQVFDVQQVRLVVDGKLFSLPAGDVSVAVGTEFFRTTLYELGVTPNNAGLASVGSNQLQFNFERDVVSGFGEVRIPIISDAMKVPLVQAFEINLSDRYDQYSDFGGTNNPKAAFAWTLGDGFKLRGNISTSFVAPPLDIVGNEYGVYVNSRYSSFTNNVNVPVSLYPNLPQMGIPGCTATSVTCNISSLQGLRINTGDHEAGPQNGTGYSYGMDFKPDFLPGLSGEITYWHVDLTGAVTGPQIGFVADTASMAKLLTFYPGGATPAQIAAATAHIPQVSSLPTQTDYILDVINSNWLNLRVSGIDASARYVFHTPYGSFTIGDSLTYFTQFDEFLRERRIL